MVRMAGNTRRSRGTSLTLIALAAACSGTVEQRYENSGSGGTEVSGVGGASGDAGNSSFGGTGFGGASGSSGGGVGGSLGIGGSFGCFVAGTRIATPSGSRPIESLRIGDTVLAYDEHAARVIPRPVTATFVHPDHPVGALSLSNGRVLRVTANHPIYLPDQQRYADAGELAGDERLLTLNALAQTSSLIAGTFQASGDAVTVYNITVDGEHNYFAEGVLVHNKSGAGGTGAGGIGEGGTAGGCVSAPLKVAGCYAVGCLDRVWPTPEYVRLNQVVSGGPEDSGTTDSATTDATPPTDGGPADAAPVSRESGLLGPDTGVTPSTNLGWPVCPGRGLPDPAFLAFDVLNSFGAPAVVGLYSGAQSCSGAQIGEVSLQNHEPPPPFGETTQCVRVPLPQPVTRSLTLAGLNAGTHVRNARFVSGCECVRRTNVFTSCGYQGGASGYCE